MRERLLAAEKVKAIDWRDARLYLLDQRRLPAEEIWHSYETAGQDADAIRERIRDVLVVRTRVELVPWGSLQRSEYKSSLVER